MIPVVSVIVTVYNRTQFLKKAIQSVLEQSYDSYEIIVTDDSNSDKIKSICEAFNRPEIRYRTNTTNIGVALNVKNAMAESKGKYIAILNDDDVWEPEFLEKLVTPLEEDSKRVLAFCNHWVILEDGLIDLLVTDRSTADFGRHNMDEGEVTKLDDFVLKKNGVPLAMAAIFRKDVIDPDLIFPEIVGAYDFWISCLLASTKRPAYFIPEKLTQYRIHSEMETIRKSPDKRLNLIFIFGKLIELKLFPDKMDYLKRKYSEILRHVGRDYLSFNQVDTARRYFKNSLKISVSYQSATALFISYMPKFVRSVLKSV